MSNHQLGEIELDRVVGGAGCGGAHWYSTAGGGLTRSIVAGQTPRFLFSQTEGGPKFESVHDCNNS